MKTTTLDPLTNIALQYQKKDVTKERKYKRVPGFSSYMVSRTGIVINTKLNQICSPIFCDDTATPLVQLKRDSTQDWAIVPLAHVVAKCWVKNPNEKLYKVVAFLDGNQNNYHANNLIWSDSILNRTPGLTQAQKDIKAEIENNPDEFFEKELKKREKNRKTIPVQDFEPLYDGDDGSWECLRIAIKERKRGVKKGKNKEIYRQNKQFSRKIANLVVFLWCTKGYSTSEIAEKLDMAFLDVEGVLRNRPDEIKEESKKIANSAKVKKRVDTLKSLFYLRHICGYPLQKITDMYGQHPAHISSQLRSPVIKAVFNEDNPNKETICVPFKGISILNLEKHAYDALVTEDLIKK